MNDAAGVPAAAAHAVPAAPPVLFDRLLTASGHAFGHATLNAPATLNSLSLPMMTPMSILMWMWMMPAGVIVSLILLWRGMIAAWWHLRLVVSV